MSRDRHSIANATRQTRGARSSAARAAVRYRRNAHVAFLLQLAMKRLTEAEAALVCARALVLVRRGKERRAA